jgi:hypothetical protein
MATYWTIDHEEVREWIEEKGGKPVLIKDDSGGFKDETLAIAFGNEMQGAQVLGWTEFFDIFERQTLVFHYDDQHTKEDSGWAYGFSGRSESMDGEDDETVLPDGVDDVEETMFPSAPANGED